MRTQRVRSIAPGTLVVVSVSLIVISAAVLVTTARANDQPRPTCTKNATSACAKCADNNNTYQCMPAGLPVGCIYGTCPNTGSGPCATGCGNQNCGNFDWNCEDPPAKIMGSTSCKDDLPKACCTDSTGC